ncbi:MAG TPA: histidine kinase [Steroidobacteraceae bacterium]|nr:histidine kinase [Steroidobacteraceae bacterium]
MERELTDAALDAIAFATGAALSAMLGLMQSRVDRNGRVSGYLILWALSFIWTFGNFLRCTLELAGASADSASARFAESLAWSCTLLGPIAVGRLLQQGIGTTSRASRGFLAFAIGVSLLNLGLFIRANLVHAYQLEASGYPATSFYIALVVSAIALLLYRAERRRADPPARKSMPRWFAPTAFVIAAVHTSAILVGMQFPTMPEGLLTATGLIGRHWPIPWSILIAVSLAQAHYADLVLKRSLGLLVSVVSATFVSMQLIDASPGFPLLTSVLVLTTLMLAAPFLARAVEALVDKTILARPDYAQAGQSLDHAFRRATQPDQIIDAALESLRVTLHVDARWVEACVTSATPPLASVTVKCADRPAHRLEITASHQARTLMQRELAFLESVGKDLQLRLDAVHFEQEQRALLLREERLQRLLTEAELKALRSQVDPHFLFNTLNTIADLISAQPEQAERMTVRLAECFRYALAKHSRNLSTLDEELAFARHYLEIEQVRFGDRLRVQLSRGDALGSEAMPSLLLQPLLENAIRHGLAPVREGGCLSVRAHREGDRLRLSIEDDGVGLRPGFDSRTGVGLRNVQDRLRTLYAQAAEFVIGDRPGGRGTTVTIVIPLHAH